MPVDFPLRVRIPKVRLRDGWGLTFALVEFIGCLQPQSCAKGVRTCCHFFQDSTDVSKIALCGYGTRKPYSRDIIAIPSPRDIAIFVKDHCPGPTKARSSLASYLLALLSLRKALISEAQLETYNFSTGRIE